MYNHDTQISFDLPSTNDHVYLTFKDNELFLTKKIMEDGTVLSDFKSLLQIFKEERFEHLAQMNTTS